jgi:halimadienyl-diphosphate synthase
MPKQPYSWLEVLDGWLAADAYSTAWIALVPDNRDMSRPAWPQTLEYLRTHQLADGGWGEPNICYAHERTLSTLAAIKAFDLWKRPEDLPRIQRGIEALHHYAECFLQEPYESIGFELLLPRLAADLGAMSDQLPLDRWTPVQQMYEQKLALIRQLQPQPGQQQSWWFSLEMLSEESLKQLEDSPRAAVWLSHLVDRQNGGVPFCWPAEVFERVWAMDSFMRAGVDPRTPFVQRLAESIWTAWHQGDPGLSSSEFFQVNDGDDTLVGFSVLNWAGFQPDEAPVLRFWKDGHFKSYLDERNASITVNIHGLQALRSQPGFLHQDKARQITLLLRDELVSSNPFSDKWHISPYYALAHAIPAVLGWDDALARDCAGNLLVEQRRDGGWGWSGHSTLEETAHVVLALSHAYQYGIVKDSGVFAKSAEFLQSHSDVSRERLWIGKTLYHPEGLVEALLYSASYRLGQMGFWSAYQQAAV